MSLSIPKVITDVVNQDLCIGCGICISECKSNSIIMDWDNNGFLVPHTTEHTCTDNGNCIAVCPFNPFPKDEVRTEDDLAEIFQLSTSKSEKKIGRYESLYVGYSKT